VMLCGLVETYRRFIWTVVRAWCVECVCSGAVQRQDRRGQVAMRRDRPLSSFVSQTPVLFMVLYCWCYRSASRFVLRLLPSPAAQCQRYFILNEAHLHYQVRRRRYDSFIVNRFRIYESEHSCYLANKITYMLRIIYTPSSWWSRK
jgi:hypothetical protein